jgi:hypothetical protein
MAVLAEIVDQKRLKRFEEQPGAMADAGRTLALVAGETAQFLQHQIGAAQVVAAQQAALEFGNQHPPRLRRKLAQEQLKPFNRVGARHRRLCPCLKLHGN